MRISLNPARFFKMLIITIIVLVFCAIASRLLFHYFKSPAIATLSFIFNLDEEHNIPSVYSFFQLLIAFVLLAITALHGSKTNDKLRKYWWLMSVLFFYIAFDELESFHERADSWLHLHYHTTGFLYFAWVLPAMIILLVLGAILLNFLVCLPRASRKRFLLAGSIYIIGAVGGDIAAGEYISLHGSGLGWPYVVEYHIEETMEMVGIAYFIYSLMLHMRDHISDEIILYLYNDPVIAELIPGNSQDYNRTIPGKVSKNKIKSALVTDPNGLTPPSSKQREQESLTK